MKEKVNYFLLVLVVFGPIGVAIKYGVAVGGIAVVSFVFGYLLFNLDKYSKIKAGVVGFEAELKEAKEAVTKTYAALEDLKHLAVSATEPVVAMMAVKPMQYLNLRSKLELAKQIEDSLDSLRVDKKEKDQVLSILYDRVRDDHIRKAVWKINEQLETGNKIADRFDDIEISDWPIEKINGKAKDIDVDVQEEVADYEYFISNRKLRREDQWQM
jgi:hypothetical protein